MIKRTELKEFEVSRSNKTMACMKIGAMDEMINVSLSYKPDDHVILVSEQGYGLMYPVEQIPLVSNKSKGVKAMNLSKDDCVASICVSQNREEQVLSFYDNPFFKAYETNGDCGIKSSGERKSYL